MQNPLSLILSPSARPPGSFRSSGSLAILLGLSALAYLAATPAAQAECQQGCDTSGNTVLGEDALFMTSGSYNVAVGFDALYSNTAGYFNVAVGYVALNSNTSGYINTALGGGALKENTTGFGNSAVGDSAMALNTTGTFNTALGEGALLSNGTGDRNIAIGDAAGINLTTGDNNIDIGNRGKAGESGMIRIGKPLVQKNTYIAGISGVTVPDGVGVIVDRGGHLGTVTSSRRYKEQIQPMGEASDKLLSLRPVTFRYKKDLDPKAIPQFGLVAEDVAKVDPDLVARDEEGKPYSVRYEAVNAMLLNEFLKAHRKLEEQGAEITELKAALAKQAAQIEKVSGRVDAAEAGPRLVSATY
jgi:Chaperone of endosialidase